MKKNVNIDNNRMNDLIDSWKAEENIATLPPLGIDFRAAKDVSKLPFADGEFDVVINRHGSFDSKEINLISKKDYFDFLSSNNYIDSSFTF